VFLEQNRNRVSIRGLLPLLEGKKDLVVAELGVLEGDSTIEVLAKYSVKKYYAIDLWEAYPGYNCEWGLHTRFDPKAEDIVYKTFVKRVHDFSQVQIIREFTSQAHLHIKDEELDFCFIDANHAYEFVHEDITLWLPKVKKGGILCGDDYRMSSVRRAVNDFFKTTSYTIQSSTENWWIVK